MTLLPSVISADYRGGFRIHLTFNDLSERTVDFRPWLAGPVFEALKDPAYFRDFLWMGVPSRGRTGPISRPRLFMRLRPPSQLGASARNGRRRILATSEQ